MCIKWCAQWKLVQPYLVPKMWKSNITSSSSMSLLNSAICTRIQNKTSYFSPISQGCFRSVVVITCASHAQGPRFDPGRKQVFLFFFYISFFFLTWKDTDANSDTTTCMSSSIPLSSPETTTKYHFFNLISAVINIGIHSHYNSGLTNWTEKALKLRQKTYHSYLTQEFCIFKVLAQYHIKCCCQSGQL